VDVYGAWIGAVAASLGAAIGGALTGWFTLRAQQQAANDQRAFLHRHRPTVKQPWSQHVTRKRHLPAADVTILRSPSPIPHRHYRSAPKTVLAKVCVKGILGRIPVA
jgi:hypothetical protein